MKFFSIGRIVGHHGLNGDVKIKPLTDNPDIFFDLTYLLLAKKGEVKRSYKLNDLFFQNKFIVACLDQVDHISKTIDLKGLDVVVPENYLPEADPDEVYWYKLQGATVFDEHGSKIGVLDDYIECGASDVFRIDCGENKFYLISNNPEHVVKIDEVNKVVYINSSGLVSEDI